MAYIRKRDAREETDEPVDNEQQDNKNFRDDIGENEYDDDLEDEEEYDDEDENFKQSLETEFPLSGGETDEDA